MKISKNVIIIGLVLLNIAVVTFFILNRPRGHFPPPQERIVEKLMLDDQQKVKFKELVKEHKSKMKSMHIEIRDAKKDAYKRAVINEESVDSELAELRGKLIAVDEHNIQHLLKVKELLNEDQLPAFNKMMKHIERIFHPGPPRPPKPVKS